MYESLMFAHFGEIRNTVHAYYNFCYSIVFIIQKLEHYLSQLILQ
jgi:hypothetical protein